MDRRAVHVNSYDGIERRKALRTILMIDDDAVFTTMVRDVFSAYWKDVPLPRVLAAHSLHEAIFILGSEDIDLLILDLQIPGFGNSTGISALLNAIGQWACTYPIVTLSSAREDYLGVGMGGQGVQEYVTKPGKDLMPRIVEAIHHAWVSHRHLAEQFSILRQCGCHNQKPSETA